MSEPTPEPRVKILLVDDQEENLLVLSSTLESLGQDLVQARSGREALKFLLQHECALIILDVVMPDLDGFETARLIRERETCRGIPIIFLTAGDPSDAKVFKGYSVGAVDYMHKPFHPDVLRSKAQVFVELEKKTVALREHERRLRETQEREHQAKAQAAHELAETRARLLADLAAKNAELERAKLRAERESQFKSRFLAGMSHELRTPLNAVIGFTEMLEQEMFGPLNPSQKVYVGLTLQSGRHLLALVNDILDISKVEAGRMALTKERATVAHFVGPVMAIVKSLAARQGVTLALELPAELPELDADPLRMKQILYNLLSNAIKFTPNGGHVVVSAQNIEGQVEIKIEDTGVGIRSEDMHRLFREFEQLENGVGGIRAEGTGLGLALTRRLVQLHGGTVAIESELNRGTTVRVRLPGAAPSPAAAHVESEAVP